MKPISLADLRPEKSEFQLREVKDHVFRIRRITIADREWMIAKFGRDGLKEIFGQIKTLEICQIVFHLLENESKEKLAAQTVTEYNDETGEKIQKKIGGVPLLKALITGVDEITVIYEALLKAIGVSEPLLDKFEQAEIAEKKRTQPKKQKKTGAPYLISSPQSTAGRSKKSKNSQ